MARRRMRVEPLEERRMLATFTVSNLLDGPVTAAGDLPGSLRQAIFDANATPAADEINLAVNGTLTLTAGELRITNALTIMGPGETLLTIDASGNDPTPDVKTGDGSRVFNIDDGNQNVHLAVEITGMTLTGGDAGGPTYEQSVGGAIYSTESLKLSHVTLAGNAAVFSGGGLFARSLNGANTIIVDSSILNNQAEDGGGIDLAGNGQLTRVLVSGNEAIDYYGGGLVLMQGRTDYLVVVDDSEIINNSAAGIGGGIVGRYFVLQNSRVAGNNAQGDGGGIYLEESATLQGNEIADNVSNDSGGGVHISIGNDQVPKIIQDNTFARNHARIGGGGMSTRSRTLLEENTFEGNTTDGPGGGLIITSNSTNNVVINNQFSDNHSVLDGGGLYIYQQGENRIEDNEFGANSAILNGGGMFVEVRSGSLLLSQNDFAGNLATQSGGGLFIDTQHDDISGQVTVDENDFTQNTAASGGGLAITTDAQHFSAEVTNNSIYENMAGGAGGVGLLVAAGDIEFSSNSVYRNEVLGVFSDGGGMQVRNAGGTVRIVNSTVSGNDAGSTGGGVSVFTQGGATSIEHSTIARNNTNSTVGGGGGIFHVGTGLALDHTIVTNNSSASAVSGLQNLYDLSATAVATHSLLSGDSKLGDLLDNGGPTFTHALLPGSRAIDAGDESAGAGVDGVPVYDQRGTNYGRVIGDRIDIGAFERQPMTIVVDTEVDEVDGDHAAGDLSLREAVAIANASLGADVTIEFASTMVGKTILLTQGQMAISNGVRIIGLGADQLTIDASGNDPTPTVNNLDGSRIFSLQTTSSIVAEYFISGLTFTGGDTNGNGGAITTGAKLTLNECVFMENSGGWGGAIFSGGSLTVINSSLTNNVAISQGGAIGGGGTLSISNSVLDNNRGRAGGAIGYQFGSMSISDSYLRNNTATFSSGGGIWLGAGGPIQVIRSAISENSAETIGGGIFARGVMLEASLISGNTARLDGGGLYSTGDLTVNNSTISGNFSDRNGGGVAASGTATFNHSTVTNNRSDNDATGSGLGGGIWKSSGALILNHTLIAGNTQVLVASDVSAPATSAIQFSYSLIGNTAGLSATQLAALAAGAGNLTNVDPMLGTLADNGGPTKTHALLPGSPAIDAGNPTFTPPPGTDQRGFIRVANGRIDIGALETQVSLPGDYDGDGDVDGRDFLLWQRGGSPNPLSSGDLSLWQEQYGEEEELSAVGSLLSASQKDEGSGVGGQELEVVEEFSALPELAELVPAYKAGSGTHVLADRYVEEADRAFEELSTLPQGRVPGFGEMVARRGMARRFEVGSLVRAF